MPKYGKSASESVRKAVKKLKKKKLKSGKSGKVVTSRKQAIAIGLSEARKKGAKVPSPSKTKKTSKKKAKKKVSKKTPKSDDSDPKNYDREKSVRSPRRNKSLPTER